MWHGHVHLDQKHIMNTWFVCMRVFWYGGNQTSTTIWMWLSVALRILVCCAMEVSSLCPCPSHMCGPLYGWHPQVGWYLTIWAMKDTIESPLYLVFGRVISDVVLENYNMVYQPISNTISNWSILAVKLVLILIFHRCGNVSWMYCKYHCFFTKLYVIDKDNLVEICKNGEQSWRHAVATSHEPKK